MRKQESSSGVVGVVPDVVDNGTEIIADVVTCCPVMSATTNNCAQSATTIGAASASDITSKQTPSLEPKPHGPSL